MTHTMNCIHNIIAANCLVCVGRITRVTEMSGCHVPLSEKEMHDNSLYTKIKELEIENKNLHIKISKLKDIIEKIVCEI